MGLRNSPSLIYRPAMDDQRNLRAAADRAIQAAGGTVALARAVGTSKQAVANWRRSRVPAERLPAVVRASGLEAAAIRPDLYDTEDGKGEVSLSSNHGPARRVAVT